MWGVIIDIVFLVLAGKFLLDIVLVIWGSKFYGVPYVPTKAGLVKEAVKRLKLRGGEKVIELGSGDGRVSIEFAKRYPVEVIGVEKIRLLLWMARARAFLTRKKGRVSFVERDLFMINLREFDVVYLYLLPRMIEKLRPKLEGLEKGAYLLSFDYPFESRKFELEWEIGGGKKIRVYRKSAAGAAL